MTVPGRDVEMFPSEPKWETDCPLNHSSGTVKILEKMPENIRMWGDLLISSSWYPCLGMSDNPLTCDRNSFFFFFFLLSCSNTKTAQRQMNAIICVTNWYFYSLSRNCAQYLTGILCHTHTHAHTHTHTHYIPATSCFPSRQSQKSLKCEPVNEFSVTEAKQTINFT